MKNPSPDSRPAIGLLAPFSPDLFRSPYLEDLIAGVLERMQDLEPDLNWMLIRDREIADYNRQQLEKRFGPLQGVLVIAWRHFARLIEDFRAPGSPPVVLINDFDPSVSLSTVYCNNREGVRKIYEHFRKKNYKKIGIIKGPVEVSPDARERFEAFVQCAEEAGQPLDPENIYESSRFDEEAGYHVMRFWLQRGNLPDALFCSNDDLARGSIQALQEKGMRIPEDIAIAGFDDSRWNALMQPSLTTVRQPLTEIGAAAVELLLDLIEGKVSAPAQRSFDPEIVVRDSA